MQAHTHIFFIFFTKTGKLWVYRHLISLMYASISTLPLPPTHTNASLPHTLFATFCFTVSFYILYTFSLSLGITHYQQVLKSITFQLSALSFSFLSLCFVGFFFFSFYSSFLSIHRHVITPFLSCLMLSSHLHHLSNAPLHSTVTFICSFIAFVAIVHLTVSALLPLQVSQFLLFLQSFFCLSFPSFYFFSSMLFY